MGVQTSIERIENARDAIIAAIISKGVNASGAKIDELAELIGSIPLPVIEALTVETNGTYSAPNGVDGYNPVKVELPTVEQATPSISVSSSGLITASATQTGGLVSSGTKSATKQLTTKGATTITPSSSVQTAVSAGTYVIGDIKVAAGSTAKVKIGSFTLGSGVNSHTFSHGLGVTPNFVGMFPRNIESGYTGRPSTMWWFNGIQGYYSGNTSASGKTVNKSIGETSSSVNFNITANASSVTVSSSVDINTSGNITHDWIAVYG